MNKWTTFGKEQKILSLHNDKIIIVAPTNTSLIVPLFCPCCEFPMQNSDDSISFRKYGVCNHCDNRWTNKPNISWPAGPNKNLKEWTEYIEYRYMTSKPVIVFK